MTPGPALRQGRFFYGWVVVAVAFVTLGIAFGIWYSFSVFFMAVIEEFGWSRAAASGIFSVFIISHALTGLLAGHLLDRFGPRIVIPFGAGILAVCLVLTSRTGTMWQFYVTYGVFAGASMSLLSFSSHSAFIPNWFERKRGLALGIAMSGIGFGLLFMIPPVGKAITAYGWRATYLYLAGTVLFLVVPLNVIFSRHRPQDLNLLPDGDDAKAKRKRPLTGMAIKVIDQDWVRERWTLRKALNTKRFWFLMSAFFFASFVYQGTLLHAISSMVDAGLPRDVAAHYFGILGLAGSGGKIFFGYLSDLFGRERINTLGNIVTAMGILCLMNICSAQGAMPLLFALFFGLGYGCAAPMFPSVSADIFLGNSFGLIFAMICMGAGVGGAMGPFVSGLLRDIFGSYSIPFGLSLVSLVFSCLFIWFAGPRKVRRMVKVST